MKIAPQVKRRHELDTMRELVYNLCLEQPRTITDLVELTGISKASLLYPLNYLERENHLIKSKHLNRSIHKWENYYRGDTKRYKAQDIIAMQKQWDLDHSRKALDTSGPYDDIINSNPHLRVVKLGDRRMQCHAGKRKSQKFTGIGSSFGLFNGA